MEKTKIDKITKVAVMGLEAEDNGLLLIVKTSSDELLEELALSIATNHPETNKVIIYQIDGRIVGKESWTFSNIRSRPIIRVGIDRQKYIEKIGLIFPQDHPIILIAKGFDAFSANDQRAYAHMVDGSDKAYGLYPKSVIIAGMGEQGTIESGTINRGIMFKLSAEN